MDLLKRLNFLRFILLFIFLNVAAVYASDEKTYLENGLQLEQEGRYADALREFLIAYTSLEEPSLAIARNYIRITAEQNMRTHYELASAIYQWGLTATDVESNAEALQNEITYLEPLLDRSLYNRWRGYIEQNDARIFEELTQFWLQMDTAPGTEYNARLLEHWERIAYAKAHFTKSDNPPFGTDDRGPLYVRYGEPDRKNVNRLETTRGKVIELSRRLDYGDMGAAEQNTAFAELMADYVQDLDPRPEYEIWVYERPNNQMEHNLVLIFGDRRTGGFGRVNAVDDFIPQRYFSTSRERFSITGIQGIAQAGVNLTPGMVMQFLYYEQLATTDFFFADKFNSKVVDWERLAAGDQSFGQHSGPIQMERNRASMLLNMQHAPAEMSTHERLLPDIPVEVYTYRFLDEQNQTMVATFIESSPMQAFISDFGFNQDAIFYDDDVTAEEGFGYYELVHGLQVQGVDGNILAQSRIPAELNLDFEENLPSSSVFSIPLHEETEQYLFFAELHNQHPDSRPRIETAFPGSLRGMGSILNIPAEPLNADEGVLEMADLVLGYEMQADSPHVLFPFVVANNRQIPAGEELAVHLEIYNLSLADDGFSDFRIDYEILPLDRRDRPVAGEDGFSITLSQSTAINRFIENLEILTRELSPGRYMLIMSATDNLNGSNAEREIIFEIAG